MGVLGNVGEGGRRSTNDLRMAIDEYEREWLRPEVDVEVKSREVTTRGEGKRIRGELGLLWRREDGLEGGWPRWVPDKEGAFLSVRDGIR